MELPKFNETFIPILEVLSDGKIIKGRELIRLVEEIFYSKLCHIHFLLEKFMTSDFFFAQEIRIENSNNIKVFFLIFF